MRGNHVAALILVAVGVLNIAYGLYRYLELGRSLLPLVPLGAVFAAIGVILMTRSGTLPRDPGRKDGD